MGCSRERTWKARAALLLGVQRPRRGPTRSWMLQTAQARPGCPLGSRRRLRCRYGSQDHEVSSGVPSTVSGSSSGSWILLCRLCSLGIDLGGSCPVLWVAGMSVPQDINTKSRGISRLQVDLQRPAGDISRSLVAHHGRLSGAEFAEGRKRAATSCPAKLCCRPWHTTGQFNDGARQAGTSLGWQACWRKALPWRIHRFVQRQFLNLVHGFTAPTPLLHISSPTSCSPLVHRLHTHPCHRRSLLPIAQQ